jgi:hypothetical protein
MSPPQGCKWLPQAAGGKKGIVGRRAGHVKQNDIKIAIKGEVLKSVVQQVHGGLKLLFADDPCAEAVGRNDDGDVGQCSGERGRFVTDLPGIGDTVRAGFKNDDPLSSTPSVTARKDARTMPACKQSLSHQDHQRSLASSAHTQVAHAYDGAVQAADFEPPATIGDMAQRHSGLKDRR